MDLSRNRFLAVRPADHHILAVDRAREERHALVARGRSGHRHQIEGAEIAGAEQLRLDLAAIIGGIGADPLIAAVIMLEVHDAQILQPLDWAAVKGKITVPDSVESR